MVLDNSLEHAALVSSHCLREQPKADLHDPHWRSGRTSGACRRGFSEGPLFDDQTPLLNAIEKEGLLPPSRCRRGSCLECAARLLAGSPFSLRVDDSAAAA